MTNQNDFSQQVAATNIVDAGTVASANSGNDRISYIDNLKWLTIIFVVMMHAAVTYSGLGSWYYKEPQKVGFLSMQFFAFFQAHLQAYFMSLFFMIAAYFIPGALQKKGAQKFIIDRLIRLGVPTLIYVFVINPLVEKVVHPNEIQLTLDSFKNYVISWDFLSGTGPMWFAFTLLIFSIAYCAIDSTITKLTNKFSFSINVRNVLFLIALITVSAFLIRLVFPIGTSVMNLQFCFFAAYIFMFMLGTIAYKKNLLEKLTFSQAKKWFIAAFVLCVPIWLILVGFLINRDGSLDVVNEAAWHGGWHWLAFFGAFWESFFCVAIIIGLVGIFKRYFNTQNTVQKFLSANAFGVYVFHPLVLVTVSISLQELHALPIIKFAVISGITIPLSFFFSSLIRKIKILRKIFS